MSNFLAEPFSLFPIKPTRSISVTDKKKNSFEFKGYLTTNEEASDELEITQHPVQQGAAITDHAYKKPSDVRIRILANDNDVPLSETYQALLKLQSDRLPMKVITGKRTYTNMLLKAVQQTTDRQTENILALSLTLQEVIIVEVSPTIVPARRKHSNAGSTGQTEKGGKKSALKVGSEGITNFVNGLKGII